MLLLDTSPKKQLIIHNTRCRWVKSNTCTYLQCKLTTIIRVVQCIKSPAVLLKNFQEVISSVFFLPIQLKEWSFWPKYKWNFLKTAMWAIHWKRTKKGMHFQLFWLHRRHIFLSIVTHKDSYNDTLLKAFMWMEEFLSTFKRPNIFFKRWDVSAQPIGTWNKTGRLKDIILV